MVYECPRCKYTSSYITNYRHHLSRKTKCSAMYSNTEPSDLLRQLDEVVKLQSVYECEFCNKGFTTSQGKWQHKQRCKSKPNQMTGDKVKDLEGQISEMRKMIHQLQENKQPMVQNVTNNYIVNNGQMNTNSQVNNNNHYPLRAFGEENKECLSLEDLGDYFFMNLDFKKLIENLHFDPDYPENQNIRIKSSKRNLMEIYRGNKWDIVTFVNGLSEVLQNGNKIFRDYHSNNKETIQDEMTKEELEALVEKMNKIDNLNTEVVKPLYKEMIALLENYRINTVATT